ncbi:MAG: PilZ domain-containing protein [Tepidisphaeraceae bacterium]
MSSNGEVSVPLPGGPERRQAPRRPDGRIARLFPCTERGFGRSQRACIKDLSDTGVGLTCLGELAVGSQFILRVERHTGPPQMRLYRVVRSRPAGGACEIGAAFVKLLRAKDAPESPGAINPSAINRV